MSRYVILALGLMLGSALSLLAGGVVSNCTEAELDAALAGGGVVTFACDGTIYLSSTKTISADTTIDGTGHAVVLDGMTARRHFKVNAGISLTIRFMTLQNGNDQGTDAYTYQSMFSCSPTAATGGQGGAIYSNWGNILIEDAVFRGNTVMGGDGGRTGDYCPPPYYTLAPAQAGQGGAIYALGGSLRIRRTMFESNRATGGGGAGKGRGTSYCTFGGVGETGAEGRGGAIYAGSALLDVRDSLFTLNEARGGSGGTGARPVEGARKGCPSGGESGGIGRGGAIFTEGSGGSPDVIHNSIFRKNSARGGQGHFGYPCCTYYGPQGTGGAAEGGTLHAGKPLSVVGSLIDGGAAYGGSAGWIDGLFGMGGLGTGGALKVVGGTVTLDDSTIASNLAVIGTGNASTPTPYAHTLLQTGGTLSVTNSILWQNPNEPALISSGGSTVISYSVSRGGWTGGVQVLDVDPKFINPLGADGVAGTADDDLRLQYSSPAVDSGNNTVVPAGLTEDLEGRPRFIDDPATVDTGIGPAPVVDMGAYEYTPDYDDDGWPNDEDCAPLNATVWRPPREARQLAVAWTPSRETTLSWLPPTLYGASTTPVYDVLAATTAPGFITATCTATGVSWMEVLESSIGSRFYLVRARNECGGTLGVSSNGEEIIGRSCP